MCGFGRTGKNFGSDLYHIQPDLMTTAKGLTAGVFPMSAALVSSQVHDVLRRASAELGGFSHGYTYSGHPLGAAVANQVLDIMERENIVENAARVGDYLHHCLKQAFVDNPHVGEIRGEGLLAGIQLMVDADSKQFLNPKDRIAAKVSQACYQHGLIIRPLPSVNSLALSPPLILTRSQVDKIVARVVIGINQVFSE